MQQPLGKIRSNLLGIRCRPASQEDFQGVGCLGVKNGLHLSSDSTIWTCMEGGFFLFVTETSVAYNNYFCGALFKWGPCSSW